jgi:hypothetical protein
LNVLGVGQLKLVGKESPLDSGADCTVPKMEPVAGARLNTRQVR